MAATALAHVPVETYLRSSFEPDAEYIDGEILERPMGEYDHSSWQQAIQRWFLQHESEWNLRVRPELRVQVAPGNYRVPDVTVLDRSLPIEQIITHPPVAVFEVLSPEDTVTRTLRKLRDYAEMGIPHIWVIDPGSKSFYRYSEGQLAPASAFSDPALGIHFEMRVLEALLD